MPRRVYLPFTLQLIPSRDTRIDQRPCRLIIRATQAATKRLASAARPQASVDNAPWCYKCAFPQFRPHARFLRVGASGGRIFSIGTSRTALHARISDSLGLRRPVSTRYTICSEYPVRAAISALDHRLSCRARISFSMLNVITIKSFTRLLSSSQGFSIIICTKKLRRVINDLWTRSG